MICCSTGPSRATRACGGGGGDNEEHQYAPGDHRDIPPVVGRRPGVHRHLPQRLDRMGQRQPVRDPLQPARHLLAWPGQAAQQDLRHDQDGKQLHRLELAAGDRRGEQPEKTPRADRSPRRPPVPATSAPRTPRPEPTGRTRSSPPPARLRGPRRLRRARAGGLPDPLAWSAAAPACPDVRSRSIATAVSRNMMNIGKTANI